VTAVLRQRRCGPMTCAGRIGQQARRTCRRPSTVATGVGDTAHERNGSLMTQHHQAAVQAAPAPTMAAWIGRDGPRERSSVRTAGPWWRRSRAVTFQEALGPTVVHHVDVEIGGVRTRALEIFEPYDAERGAFPTRAYDDRGGVEPRSPSCGTVSGPPAPARPRHARDGRGRRAAGARTPTPSALVRLHVASPLPCHSSSSG